MIDAGRVAADIPLKGSGTYGTVHLPALQEIAPLVVQAQRIVCLVVAAHRKCNRIVYRVGVSLYHNRGTTARETAAGNRYRSRNGCPVAAVKQGIVAAERRDTCF